VRLIQTFLPYKSFESSARVLDDKRLGKQRVEIMQIMHALIRLQGHNDIKGGAIPWANHPATLMWKGFEHSLLRYQEAMCGEWIRRGFNDTCLEKTADLLLAQPGFQIIDDPRWLGLKKFHSPHRANLLRKDPDHYGKFGWSEEPAEGYFWPKHG
jgi:hypothetical protein